MKSILILTAIALTTSVLPALIPSRVRVPSPRVVETLKRKR